MTALPLLKKWFEQHRSKLREDYFHFLRFKSISNDPACSKEMRRCAEWLRDYIGGELIETETYPLVYSEDLRAGPNAPTLLIYGHYDVMPVAPLELWESDPFEPTEQNGSIYARGAVDDKGQIFYALLAAKVLKELGRTLPINLKFCIEGEEESNSIGLIKALPKLKEKLKADSVLVVDFSQFDREIPAVTLGARGLLALEVTLTGSKGDLHSGSHGGIAYNPNKALVKLLSKLWDENERVQVNGFYDDVLEPTEEEKREFLHKFNQTEYTNEFGVEAFGNEKGRSLVESNCLRPVVEINGMGGGYFESGFMTMIPAHAIAKISCRLVPKQDPDKIFDQITHFLKSHVVPGMQIKIELVGAEPAFRSNLNSTLAKAVASAATEVTGKQCKYVLSGGSIPITTLMANLLGSEAIGMGYCLPTDAIHAPNEHFDMNRLEKGFLTIARTLELLSST